MCACIFHISPQNVRNVKNLKMLGYLILCIKIKEKNRNSIFLTCLYISYFSPNFKKEIKKFEYTYVFDTLHQNLKGKKKFEKSEHVLAYL